MLKTRDKIYWSELENIFQEISEAASGWSSGAGNFLTSPITSHLKNYGGFKNEINPCIFIEMRLEHTPATLRKCTMLKPLSLLTCRKIVSGGDGFLLPGLHSFPKKQYRICSNLS